MGVLGFKLSRPGSKVHVMRACLATLMLVASFAWAAPEDASADHSACPRFRKSPRAMQQDIGRMFRYDNFKDDSDRGPSTAGDGVPNQFSASSDYQTGGNESGHCRRNVFQPDDFAAGNTVVHQEIYEGVDNSEGKKSGDVSIYIMYKAKPGHTFRARANVNLFAESGDFRGRLKIVGLDGNFNQVKPEYNVDICSPERPTPEPESQKKLCDDGAIDSDDGYQTISVVGEMCRNTEYVNVVFRARENQTENAYGVAALDWIEFERIRHQDLGKCAP